MTLMSALYFGACARVPHSIVLESGAGIVFAGIFIGTEREPDKTSLRMPWVPPMCVRVCASCACGGCVSVVTPCHLGVETDVEEVE